jgi:hypothetical protein
MEKSWLKQPFHVPGDGKKGGSLELFLTHHTATPGTSDVSQNTAKCAWDIRMYAASLFENKTAKQTSVDKYVLKQLQTIRVS